MQIHWLKTRWVNTFLIQHDHRFWVVDVAGGGEWDVLAKLDKLGHPPQAVELVVCTHDDPDHMAGLRALASHCDAAVALPWASGRQWLKWRADPIGVWGRLHRSLREALRPRAWRMYLNPRRHLHSARRRRTFQQQLDYPVLPPSPMRELSLVRLKDQQALPGFGDWQVLHTPGHSWDSVCFYHRDSGSLITGDTLLGSGALNALVAPAIYANHKQLRDTIRGLKSLPLAHVYPGHGAPQSGELQILDL